MCLWPGLQSHICFQFMAFRSNPKPSGPYSIASIVFLFQKNFTIEELPKRSEERRPWRRRRSLVGSCCYCCFFGFVLTKKEKKHDLAKFPSKIKTQRQVKSQHCTFSPKSPKFQEYQNNYPKLPNHSKIDENLGKTQKKHKRCQKTYKVKGETT